MWREQQMHEQSSLVYCRLGYSLPIKRRICSGREVTKKIKPSCSAFCARFRLTGMRGVLSKHTLTILSSTLCPFRAPTAATLYGDGLSSSLGASPARTSDSPLGLKQLAFHSGSWRRTRRTI